MLQGMVIQMNDGQLQTLAQLQAFLGGTIPIDFSLAAEERYGFIGRTVHRFSYRRLERARKAVVLRFLERVSGYSRQQLTRLVKRAAERARSSRATAVRAPALRAAIRWLMCCCCPIPMRCTGRSRDTLPRSSWSGPGACTGMGATSAWLAISVAHLYNLRQRSGYQRHRGRLCASGPYRVSVWAREHPRSVAQRSSSRAILSSSSPTACSPAAIICAAAGWAATHPAHESPRKNPSAIRSTATGQHSV